MKQVIVVRKDLQMRKGKFGAQVAHAASEFLRQYALTDGTLHEPDLEWLHGDHKKIVVGVETLDQLLTLAGKAAFHKVKHIYLVEDKGLTEFKQPTVTCLALGPDDDAKLDKITGDLKLL